LQIIRRNNLVATPWKNGGGVTRQIACFPEGSDLSTFDWRISTAEVAQDGAFSRFDGVDRRLYILDGAGLELRFGTKHVRRLRAHDYVDFAGEAEVLGALIDGPVTDLNIMVRRDRMRMRAERISVDGPARIEHGWGTAALFVLEGELSVMSGVARRHDTVLLDGTEAVTVSGPAGLLMIGLQPVA
jgi:environmental stress-induced protein Ves